MPKQLFLFLLLMTVTSIALQGQATPHLAPNSKALDAIETLSLPALDNEELLREEMARRAPGVAPRFAQRLDVDVSPQTHGKWRYRNGKAIWHLRVPSPGAKSLNFGFDQYVMPAGGSLLIYSLDQREIQGPFTPADNEVHEELWTPVIHSDDVIIELSLPIAKQQEVKLHMTSVNHDFLGFAEVMSSVLSGSCNLDVACGSEDGWGIVDGYRDIIQSVAVYGQGGDTFCTGFLVNNTRQDCTPYFMTANHCGISAGGAPSVVVYWNYMNSFCRQPGSLESGSAGNGSLSNFNTGSTLRASHSPSDMTLLELDDPVPLSADAFFAGWDARQILESDTTICVHHPDGEEKRISFEFDGVYRGAWGQGGTPVPNGNHLIIEDWNIGTTEMGSSGSPLFNSDRRVVGQLHGGAASCSNNEYDSYGWFATSWTGGGTSGSRLRDWLDPDNSGTLTLDGHSAFNCNFAALADPVFQSLCTPDAAVYSILVSESFAGPVTLTLAGLPAGLNVVFDNTVVAPGEGTQMTVTGTGSLSTGTYQFSLLGTDGVNSSNQLLTLELVSDTPAMPVLSEPSNGAGNQGTSLDFVWNTSPSAEGYALQLATDPSFANVVFTADELSATTLFVPNLEVETTYYWRVRGNNICGAGGWSTAYSFTTAVEQCGFTVVNTAGLSIGPSEGAITNSQVFIDQDGEILSVKINGLSTDHSWVGDLNATLRAPSGTTINLFNRPDCGEPGMFVDFADDAPQTSLDFESTCSDQGVAIQGAFQPVQAFSNFNGQSASGTWTLSIQDNANFDGGELLGWNLEICTDLSNSTVEVGGAACQVWPNPATDLINIRLAEDLSGAVNARLFSVDGRQMLQQNLEARAGLSAIDIARLPSGVYLLQIQHQNARQVLRIVKQE